jgi:hypothetical protein
VSHESDRNGVRGGMAAERDRIMRSDGRAVRGGRATLGSLKLLSLMAVIVAAFAACSVAHDDKPGVAVVASALFSTSNIWSSDFSDQNGWKNGAYAIRLGDVNGDGLADVCGRGSGGVWCALSNGREFGAATEWMPLYSDANGWADPVYADTIQLGDVNGDGRADLCGRGAAGVRCSLSTGTSFGKTADVWSAAYSDANGWNNAIYSGTIRLADINGDKRADLCGRGNLGIWCAITNGRSFDPPTRWTPAFNDASGWGQTQYAGTIQLADINDDGRADVCGRAADGIHCALSSGSRFAEVATVWSSLYTDADGWGIPRYGETFRIADVNGDGPADLCVRGVEGERCSLSTGQQFTDFKIWASNFADANWWGLDPAYYRTIQLGDIDGDGRADICGRSIGGISCNTSVDDPPADLPRFDEVTQRSIHNAYVRDESILDQLIYYRIRDIEIDIHSQVETNNCGGSPSYASSNDWFVYHTVQVGRFDMLSDLLRILRGYQNAVPQHEAVIVNLELKGNHDGTNCDGVFPDGDANARKDRGKQTPEGLDKLIKDYLGPALFTAADLLRACPAARTVQEAADPRICGWPRVDAMRGKFVFVAHGDHDNGNQADLIGTYMQNGAAVRQRVVWPAPMWRGAAELDAMPYAAFVSEVTADGGALTTANAIHAAHPGVILRSADKDDVTDTGGEGDAKTYVPAPWKIPNLEKVFQRMLTDEVSFFRTPDYRTHNRFGYPFCPIGGYGSKCWDGTKHATSELKEIAQLLALDVRSGDIAGTSDNFTFARQNWPNQAATTWSAYIATPNNPDIPEWSKGCLMARATLIGASPYYAVCRAGNNHELFVRWRANDCGSRLCDTHEAEASLGGTQFLGGTNYIDGGEDAIFVKLELTQNGLGGVRAQGYGSLDGITYQAIGAPHDFTVDLPFQGIAASSMRLDGTNYDGSPLRILFGNVARNGVFQHLFSTSNIGAVQYAAFDDLSKHP